MMNVARVPTRSGFGLGWIGANAAGYALAFAVWQAVSQPVWPALSGLLGGSLTLALFGAAIGVGASLAQAVVLRQRPALAGLWSAATTLGFALGFVVASWAALSVSRALASGADKYTLHTAVNGTFFLLVGASVGVARWLVLRGSGAAAIRWIPASAVGFMLGYATALGLFDLNILGPMPTPVFGALLGAIAGAVTALIEWLWLRSRPEAWPVAHTLPDVAYG